MHLGPFPLERMKRTALPAVDEGAPRSPRPSAPTIGALSTLREHARRYQAIFEQFRQGEVAVERAPIPEDAAAISHDLKSACYFLDATMVGACTVPLSAWYDDAPQGSTGHANAIVILVEHGRTPEPDNLAYAWVQGADADRTALHAAEIAVVLAGYVRALGWPALAHTTTATDVDLEQLTVRAGLGWERRGKPENPFVGRSYEVAVVTTDIPVASDRPLAQGRARDLRYLIGWGGTESGLDRWTRRRRRTHLSRYPMEKIRRVDEPTTLIFEDEVPRVPKRAAFFERARRGDLGERAQIEMRRFAWKHPYTLAMMPLMRDLVPHQDRPAAQRPANAGDDPEANSRAVKSLAYYLGADLAGICEAKPYAWYSHDTDGTPMEPKHRYAIVLLIDQGHETMEGTSGDDWISGAQSMRGYLRGAEIAGLMAAQIRALGSPARAQTNADSDVLQLPLVLLAGLGELSRIGELVLNPFVGPRFKSAVVTTDLPLAVDRAIDFGLQDQRDKCMKCARECPCNAISFGDKVIFNGYEMWKPDVERCARYRVTNPHGSACGRCMKMCPYTNEGLLVHRAALWATIKLPFVRRWVPWLDDRVRNGSRNPVKKWWWDLEWVRTNGVGKSVVPAKTNNRDLLLERGNERNDSVTISY